jgi:hypothetical protein
LHARAGIQTAALRKKTTVAIFVDMQLKRGDTSRRYLFRRIAMLHPLFRDVCLVAALSGFVAVPIALAQTTTIAVVTDTVAMFLYPDATRQPLLMLEGGVEVKVLQLDGGWANVSVEGSERGTRVGYVMRSRLRILERGASPAETSVPVVTAADVAAARAKGAGATGTSPARNGAQPVASVAPLPTPAITGVPTAAATPRAVATVPLGSIRRVYIDKMDNGLDQYIAAEITKQFKGRLTVVLDPANADVIMRGVNENHTGAARAITGRYLGLHDNASGSITLIDPGETVVLWASEAGDRSLMFGVMKRGGQRKVADRLVHNLKDAIEHAK